MLNLKKNEQGVVELNGEPIADWFRKRRITPCERRYVEIGSHSCKMCLIAAMGFSAIENRKTATEYKEAMIDSPDPVHKFIAFLLGDVAESIKSIELGFLSREWEMKDSKCPKQKLGHAARVALIEEYGAIDVR